MVFRDAEHGINNPTSELGYTSTYSGAIQLDDLDGEDAHLLVNSNAGNAQPRQISPERDGDYIPPLFISFTGYRLACAALIVGFGIPKAVAYSRGQPAADTLDWVISIIAALGCVCCAARSFGAE